MLERNQLTLDNVILNDSRSLLDIYNQLQTFRTYYKFNNMDIDRYDINGKYEQVFIGARELSTDDLPDQAQTRSEEHTSELQSRGHLVCRLLLEKKKT